MQTMAIGLNHRTTRQHRPWAVWFALCIALVMAIAPTLSHALASNQGAGRNFMEVCISTGTRLVPLEATSASAASSTEQEAGLTLSRCPYCLTNVASLGLPPAPLPFVTLALLRFEVPPLQLEIPRVLIAWRAPAARAPPSLN